MAPQPVPNRRHHHEYATKIVCGVVREEKGPINVGRYFTAVNVHNPSARAARVCVKLAIARPNHGGSVTGFHSFDLKPDQAIEFDCDFIHKLAEGAPFVKGFLVIKCFLELDVVAVYTAGELRDSRVSTMHTERVPVRNITGGFEC